MTSGVKCGRCDKVIESQKIIPATGHDVVTVEATAPTCTQAGHTSYSYCKGCGEVYGEKEEIAALGHTEGVSVDSDVSCNRCGLNGREAYLDACQWEEAATKTKLSQGDDIPAGEVEGAYRYKGNWTESVYGVSLLKFETFEIDVEGDTETEGEISVYTTALGKIYLKWEDEIEGTNFRLELTSVEGKGRIDFYLADDFTCAVTVYDYDGEAIGDFTISVRLGSATVRYDELYRLELISE